MIYELIHILNCGYASRLHYAIAKVAFIIARIITSLDFISAVQYMIHFICHFTVRQWRLFTVLYYSMTHPISFFSVKLAPSLVVMAWQSAREWGANLPR